MNIASRAYGVSLPKPVAAHFFLFRRELPWWGFGWVDKAQCFRLAKRFGAAGSSPDFSRLFHDIALQGLCLETFFQCTILSYPGQPSYSHAFRWASELAKFYQDWGPDLCKSRWRAHSPIGPVFSFECPYQHPPWSPVWIGKPAPPIHHWIIYFRRWGFGWVDKAQFFRLARRFDAACSSLDFSRVFHDMALLGLCLELSFNILYCRTQANPPTLTHFAEPAIWPSSIRTEDPTCANHVDVLTVRSALCFPSNVHINILRGLPCGLESLRLQFTNESSISVDGDLAELIKHSSSDWLGDLMPHVQAWTFPGFFTTWRF